MRDQFILDKFGLGLWGHTAQHRFHVALKDLFSLHELVKDYIALGYLIRQRLLSLDYTKNFKVKDVHDEIGCTYKITIVIMFEEEC